MSQCESTVQLIQKRSPTFVTRRGLGGTHEAILESIQPNRRATQNGRRALEVILSYVGNGSKAAPTAKILGAAARSRAARPYFLTALKRGAAPVALPARLESAARRIGGFLLRRARERMGKEEEPRPKQEQIPDIKTTVKQLISEIKPPAPPHIAVLFASGGWAGRLADLREALRAFTSPGVARGAAPVLGATQSVVDEVEPRSTAPSPSA